MHWGVQPYGLERRATDHRFWTGTPCSIWDAIEKEYCDSILLRIQFSFKKIKSNAFSLLKRVSMIAVIFKSILRALYRKIGKLSNLNAKILVLFL